jgi:hypothetical protein
MRLRRRKRKREWRKKITANPQHESVTQLNNTPHPNLNHLFESITIQLIHNVNAILKQRIVYTASQHRTFMYGSLAFTTATGTLQPQNAIQFHVGVALQQIILSIPGYVPPATGPSISQQRSALTAALSFFEHCRTRPHRTNGRHNIRWVKYTNFHHIGVSLIILAKCSHLRKRPKRNLLNILHHMTPPFRFCEPEGNAVVYYVMARQHPGDYIGQSSEFTTRWHTETVDAKHISHPNKKAHTQPASQAL